MEQDEILAKLTALRRNIAARLTETRDAFSRSSTEDLFSRYSKLRDLLRSKYPSLFDDLPVRRTSFAHIQGKEFVTREILSALLADCNYCLDILTHQVTISVPSMRVTREGVFFAGQYFDALQRVSEILSSAQKSIVIIDGYVNETVLNLLTSKGGAVVVDILTKVVSPALNTAATAFNKQYGGLSIRTSQAFHDRFVIVDDRDFYHFGASIKDVGHRGFMFSNIEEPGVMDALRTKWAQEWAKAKIVV